MAPLDGIRAIAIIAVLIYHVSPVVLSGGFTGVDVFFVLSGFLITSIVSRDIREGTFSIREFYLRRIQRLLPNIVITVLAVLVLWTLFLPGSMARQAGSHGLWTLFNLSNIFIWQKLGGYWGDAAEWSPLTHTWSLGIEEQFYLLFPGSLVLLARFQPGRVRLWMIGATVLSFGLCLYRTHAHPTSTFYLLPTRVWELLLGAVLAAHRTPIRHTISTGIVPETNTRETIGWVGLGIIVIGFLIIDEGDAFPGLVSLAPTVGTALVLLSVAGKETRVSRLLARPLMVGTGKLSYSLYLWHWPLITLGKIQAEFHGFPRLGGAIAGALAGILLAWLAYVYVEQPLRNRGSGRSRRLAMIGAGFAVVALCSAVVASRRMVADPDHRFDTPAYYGQLFNAGRPADISTTTAVRYYDVYFPPLPPRPDDSWRTGGIVHPYGGGRPRVVVLGSSHALMYSRLIDNICRDMGISVAFLGVDQTAVFFETTVNPSFHSPLEAHEFDDTRRRFLREWRPDAVFVIDRWDGVFGTPQVFDERLRSFLREVSPLAGRVIWVAQVPVARGGNKINLREIITAHMGKVKGLPRLDPDSKEDLRQQAVATAEKAAADFQNLRVLRVDLAFYQEDRSVRYAAGRNFFYADDNHLSDVGTEVVRKLFEKAIADATAASASQ